MQITRSSLGVHQRLRSPAFACLLAKWWMAAIKLECLATARSLLIEWVDQITINIEMAKWCPVSKPLFDLIYLRRWRMMKRVFVAWRVLVHVQERPIIKFNKWKRSGIHSHCSQCKEYLTIIVICQHFSVGQLQNTQSYPSSQQPMTDGRG